MKKRLLTQLLAVVCAVGAYAFNVGDYVYTENARLKITGANLVENGAFTSGTNGWTNAAGAPVSADVFSLVEGLGPNGENVIQSLGATADNAFCGRWALDAGTYVVSFDVKVPSATNSSVSNWSEKDGVVTYATPNNYFDVFINPDGALSKVKSTEETPVVGVATATYLPAEWKTVSFVANIQAEQQLVLHFEQLITETMFTNISIHKVAPVYDVRSLENKMDFVKGLLNDSNFNVAEAESARSELVGFIESYSEFLASGELDDESTGAAFAEQLDEYIENYLGVTSVNLVSLIPGLDISSLIFTGRGGDLKAAANGLQLDGGNWGHLNSEADVLRSAIQTGYGNYKATYNCFHVDLPAGKYFFSAEIRNANTGKSSWPTEPVFTAETDGCKMFIANDSIELPTIKGEQYQRFYMIADVAEDGQFRAGVYWPGLDNGGAFFIRNTMARAFNLDVVADVQHVQAFKKYIEQWNAATSSRHTLIEMQSDDNFPWGKQVLADARATWDPYYKAQASKQWSDADGKDTGVATTDELNDWALYQGVELYSEPDEEQNTTRLEYQVVRGYQNAVKAVRELNQPFEDLALAIEQAKQERNKGTNATGDRDAFKIAIETAIAIIKEVRSTTTDETREADTERLQQALANLQTAQNTFMASVTGSVDLVDIDFSNSFALDSESGLYFIKGALGQMEFPSDAVDLEHGDGTGSPKLGYHWSQGWNGEYLDVLRIGSPAATVNLPEELTDNDVIRVSFDFWGGYLNKCYTKFDLQNKDGQSIAQITRYNSQGTSSNDFGVSVDDLNKYISVTGSSSTQNNLICVDANKSSIEMTFDYLNGVQKLKIVHAKQGTLDATPVAINTELEDNKVAKLVVSSNYSSQNNSARRSWFDNLKIVKQTAGVDQEEDITEDPRAPKPTDVDYDEELQGIRVVVAEKYANTIYNLAGQKLNGKLVKGIYIMNGKKFIVK